ncbi:MAG: FGGY-family carbohydrate kinase, partial [Actinomycetota bacterium]
GTTRAHIARAVVESIAYQVRDVIDTMVSASATPITDLRVDGGASVMDLLCQFQADQLDATVNRPVDQETTALGAAFLAGLAEGVWASTDAIGDAWTLDASFSPAADRSAADAGHADWLRAVDRSRGWATS